MSLLNQIKAYWYSGGQCTDTLHGVLEDGNVEDITLDFLIKDFEGALSLLRAMRARTYATRWKALEQFGEHLKAEFDAQMKAIQEEKRQANG